MATIVSMEELFHPKIQQTVILNGDKHVKDISQKEDLLVAIQKNNVYSIIEGGGIEAKDIFLLRALVAALGEQHLACHNPEFREGLARFSGIMFASMEMNYNGVKEFWQTSEIKRAVYSSFLLARENAFTILCEIKNNLADLKKEDRLSQDDIEMLCVELDNLGAIYNEINTDMRTAVPQDFIDTETDLVVAYLFNNIFIDDENGQVFLNRSSLEHKMFELSNKLFDMRVVIHILQNNQKPVVFVCAGCLHTDNIAIILQKLGFILHTEKKLDLLSVEDIEEVQKNGQSLREVFTSDIWANRQKLNVQEFITSCKTLKKNPPADVAAAG